jgi:hypothetical protein
MHCQKSTQSAFSGIKGGIGDVVTYIAKFLDDVVGIQ